MVTLNISDREDIRDVYESLLSVGVPNYKAQKVCMTLSKPNTGYTLTDYEGKFTLIFISRATTPSQMYDSIQHETKHAVEHISNYYNVDPKSEESAYLQGEISRLMFPAAAMAVFPLCSSQNLHNQSLS